MARLTIISPEGNRRVVNLGAHTTLGRHPDNTIQLLDRIVSKNHCNVDFVNGKWILKDLESLNGTFVNGQRMSGERELFPNDEVTVGSTRIVFEEDAACAVQKAGPAQSGGHVTVSPDRVESHVRSKLAQRVDESFLPEKLIADATALRQDYEKLRMSYELVRAVGVELEAHKLLQKILACAFDLLPADRGVVLLLDDKGEPLPGCVRTRKNTPGEEVAL